MEHDPYESYLSSDSTLCVMPERVIHSTRMGPRDLGFSLTDNWRVIWDLPLVVMFLMSDLSTLSSGTSIHPDNFSWLLGARALRILAHATRGPVYVAPTLPVVSQCPGTVGTVLLLLV